MQPSLPSPRQVWSTIEPLIEPLSFGPQSAQHLELTQADGRRLVSPICAQSDLPRADISAMDGYAYQGDLDAGATLNVIGEIAAGAEPKVEVKRGDAVAIMTGGCVPRGADRVVPVEQVEKEAGLISVIKPVRVWAHIRRQAELHARGDTVVHPGVILDPVHLGVAASHGLASVAVAPCPRIGFFTTGDEVVDPSPENGELDASLIYDSHTPMVLAACRRRGAAAENLGIVDDDESNLRGALQRADHDIVITSGGVSAGSYDLVPKSAVAAGFEPLVHGIAMQPGKPVFIARRSRQWLLALPGNPAAVWVAFQRFAVPLLAALAGAETPWTAHCRDVAVTSTIHPHRSRWRYLPAKIERRDGSVFAAAKRPLGSHDLAAFAGMDALLELPPGDKAILQGRILTSISAA